MISVLFLMFIVPVLYLLFSEIAITRRRRADHKRAMAELEAKATEEKDRAERDSEAENDFPSTAGVRWRPADH
jgi:flagellar biosynthesis/type III secretory pathway M-ring protein FliF/YscJ